MEPASEEMLGQSKSMNEGEMAASPFVQAVSLFMAESSSATTNILKSLQSWQPVAPLQASPGKQPELLVLWKFFQATVFTRAEHPNLNSLQLSCALVPLLSCPHQS